MSNVIKTDIAVDKNYLQFFEEAKQKIQATRIQIAKAACQQQITLYWWFGQKIVEAQEKYGWGKSVVESLSKDLKRTFGGTFGFSAQNLWYMRQFYLEYKDQPKLQQLVGEIPWGQNLAILSKVKGLKEREYYINAVREMGWTRDILVAQINSQANEFAIV